MFNIQEELKRLPDEPGVYIMKNEKDEIIYVGKAKILKNRVRQYFHNSADHTLKVKTMVSHIASFEYIVTASEREALILENNLIKKHTPRYNILLKDDKTYPYIKITVNEDFPRIFITRKHIKDKAKYFGPFTNSTALKEDVRLVHDIWQIRDCTMKIDEGAKKIRPCLNYHIGKCSAPCAGLISKEKYGTVIDSAIKLLSGKTDDIKKELTEKMFEFSKNMEYEKAAKYRDLIKSLDMLKEKQVIDNLHNDERDVIGFSRRGENTVFQVFFIRGGKISGREHFLLDNCEEIPDDELMQSFLQQFYSGTPYIPKEIILQCDITGFDLISGWLSEIKGQRVNILVPVKGERKLLADMAANNALIAMDRLGINAMREHKRTLGALNEIKEALGVDFDLKRIESYDISHTGGVETVASMVVFENGVPKKSDYRKFKIKTVEGPDDYASMYEVITRRFQRYISETETSPEKTSFSKLPDLIMLDGGKGQITVVKQALEQIGINVPISGMVKDDKHRTRALLFNDEEKSMKTSSEGFKLVTRIQDEVHRFAIEYHRKLRQKRQTRSVLDEISGIGPTRKKALMEHFKDINNIKQADIQQLKQVSGMNEAAAISVYEYFHGVLKGQ